jgi:hypothetical protein
MKVDAKLAEIVPLTHKFAKQSRVGFFCKERTRSTPLDPKLMFWGVWDRFVTARKSMQNWPNWFRYRTSALNKVASEFFATNAPDPLHWTQNSCFGAFGTVLLLHESRCQTKQSRIGIFRNERTRSTALHPISCFGAFRTVFLLHESRCKTGRTVAINVLVRQTKSRRNFSQRTHQIHSI